MATEKKGPEEVLSMNGFDLSVDELEKRLELAAASVHPNFPCGINGCFGYIGICGINACAIDFWPCPVNIGAPSR